VAGNPLQPAAAPVSVANSTAQAVAALAKGGSAAPSTDQQQGNPFPGYVQTYGPDGPPLTANQDNAIVAAANAMTSQQLSAAIYGSGVQTTGFQNSHATWASTTAQTISVMNDLKNQANDPFPSAAERQSADSALKGFSNSASMDEAYNNHTLVIQKATDVHGLDYQGVITYYGANNGNAPPNVAGGPESYNANFFLHNPDGKHHSLGGFGNGVMLYFTLLGNSGLDDQMLVSVEHRQLTLIGVH
jgi:hypothetical protein